MSIDRRQLLELLLTGFNPDQYRLIAHELGVAEYLSLSGSPASQATALIAFMERRGKLESLVDLLQTLKPQLFPKTTPAPAASNVEATNVANLNIDLASIRQQLEELQKGSLTTQQIEQRIQEVLKTTNRAVGQSEELTARVILPPQENMDVRLVPSHSLERLEEYRSDENVAFLLIGAFGGAVLGILSNWATSEAFVITRFSLVLMLMLVVFTIACVAWVRNIHRRAELVKKQIFSESIQTRHTG